MFGKNLKKLAEAKGLTLKQIAEKSDISYQQVLNIANEKNIPNVIYGYRLAEAMNTSVERLVTGHRKNKCDACYYSDLLKEVRKLNDDELEIVKKLVFLLSSKGD